jgi:hypothetical protein
MLFWQLSVKIYMKYSAVLFFLFVLACGCNHHSVMTNLLSEQKLLKDSANNINERIGGYMEKGVYETAEAEKKQLGAIHARLISIQFSIDSLGKMQ